MNKYGFRKRTAVSRTQGVMSSLSETDPRGPVTPGGLFKRSEHPADSEQRQKGSAVAPTRVGDQPWALLCPWTPPDTQAANTLDESHLRHRRLKTLTGSKSTSSFTTWDAQTGNIGRESPPVYRTRAQRSAPCCPARAPPRAPAPTSPGALVIEEDAVDREEVVGLPEVHHDPVGVELRRPCRNLFLKQRNDSGYYERQRFFTQTSSSLPSEQLVSRQEKNRIKSEAPLPVDHVTGNFKLLASGISSSCRHKAIPLGRV